MLYEKIEKICKEKDISIARLEREAGVGNGVVGRWRTSSPTVDKLKAVAKVLNVPIEQLLE